MASVTRRDLLVCGLLAPAQEPPVFRAETSLALVRFHAVRKNRWVNDLTRSDIVLLENGIPQKVALLEGGRTAPRTVPLEVILLFDTSGSVMQAGLFDPLLFQQNLLDGLGHASLALYTFGRELRLYTPPTRDLARLTQAFGRIEDRQAAIETVKLDDSRSHDPNGATFLYEAIMETARRASRSAANATRILVIVSDGFPTTLTKPQEAADVARECGIAVYPVVLGHWRLVQRAGLEQLATFDSRGTANPRAQQRLARIQEQETTILEFAELGEKTGGRSFDPRDLNSLVARQILQAMASHIQAEYVAGYYPAPAATPAKPRRIEVKLRSPALGKVRGGVRALSAR